MLALTVRHPWSWAIKYLEKRLENRSWAPPAHLIGQHIAIHGGAAPKSKREWTEVAEDVTGIYTRILPQYPPEKLQELRAYFAASFPSTDPDKTSITLEHVVIPGIFAVARLAAVVTNSHDPWFATPQDPRDTNYGWVLEDVVMLPDVVPCKGAQKLWTLPQPVLEQVRAGYKLARDETRAA
jgi:hypothetical protein